MPKTIMFTRIFLTAFLLYGVYTETGIWTTLSLVLITISIELSVSDHLLNKLKETEHAKTSR